MEGLSRLPQERALDANTQSWVLRSWNNDLYCCTRLLNSDSPPRHTAVIDIGSNSLKLVVYDMSQKLLLTPIDSCGQKCGLAAGMTPGSPEARLNADGMKKVLNDALPEFKKIMNNNNVDTVVVVCTEAIRAAYKFDEKAVSTFIGQMANVLDIPPKAINILSGEEEASLAAEATLISRPDTDGVSIMGGGASAEFSLILNGVTTEAFRRTVQMGSQSLATVERPESAIRKAFDDISWMRNTADAHGGSPVRDLVLLGGFFRGAGRLLAQNIRRESVIAKIPVGGYTFECNDQFKTEVQKLLDTNYAALRDQFIQRKLVGTGQLKPDDFKSASKPQQLEPYSKFLSSPDYKEWEKHIGKRASAIRYAAMTIVQALDAVRPSLVNFSPVSIREAVINQFSLKSWQQPFAERSAAPLQPARFPPASTPAPFPRRALVASHARR